jgi:hypothetical protein
LKHKKFITIFALLSQTSPNELKPKLRHRHTPHKFEIGDPLFVAAAAAADANFFSFIQRKNEMKTEKQSFNVC